MKLVPMFTAALLATTMPNIANAGEVVEFAFRESELTTPAKRELLLTRIEKEAMQSCESGSAVAPKSAIKRCAADLMDQFVRAIDDPQLTLLAEPKSRALFRTASR